MIGDEENGATFIEPGLEDEIDNWDARQPVGEVSTIDGIDGGLMASSRSFLVTGKE